MHFQKKVYTKNTCEETFTQKNMNDALRSFRKKKIHRNREITETKNKTGRR